MLSIGGELYRLTARDEATLPLEWFHQQVVVSIPIGITSATAVCPLPPLDRCLYLAGCSISANYGAAGSRPVFVGLGWRPDQLTGSIQSLVDLTYEATIGASNRSGVSTLPQVILPRGGQPIALVDRTDTTVAGSITATWWGYLVPPGSVGRFS